MNAVLLAIHPKYCELIASGKKTVEVRKTKPRINAPFKCYIYCTLQGSNEFFKEDCNGDVAKWNRSKMAFKKGKVIGEFVCDSVTGGYWIAPFSDYLQSQSCLSYDEVCDYANGKPIFAWHISDLKIYDKPKALGDFNHCGVNYHFNPIVTRPPQNWCYVEEIRG